MIIPPQAVPAAAADCAAAGVKGVVISTEGFAETGEAGREYQEQLADVLRDSGMRCFGPNTLGVINTATGLTTSYFVDRSMLKPGGIGVAAQSGIFVGALLRYISTQGGLGLSKGLGLGNKVDVDESDALRFFRRDEYTRRPAIRRRSPPDVGRQAGAAGQGRPQRSRQQGGRVAHGQHGGQ
jgi:acyl-CoA synthetase (NDP forming)